MDSKGKTRQRSRTAGVLIIVVLQEKLSSVQRIVLPNCIILILPVWLCSSLNYLVGHSHCFFFHFFRAMNLDRSKEKRQRWIVHM